jgi:serine/threonine-protein kinase
VPSHVAAATVKSLEKLAADRFESAAKFAEALTNPECTIPRATAPASAAPSEPPAGRWNRVGAGMTAATVLFAILAAWGWMGRARDRDATILRLRLDHGEIVPHPWADVIVSPGGSAFAVAGVVGGQRNLHVRRADEDRFRLVPGTENALFPAFSPDGEWIVFRDGDQHALLKVSISGGAPMTVLPAGLVRGPRASHWGDDGTIVFGSRDGLVRIPETGGEPELLLEDAGWAFYPRLLPGGRGVLFTDVRSSSISLFDLEADSLRQLVPEGLDAMFVATGHLLYAHPSGGLFAAPFDLKSMEVTGQSAPVLDDVWVLGGLVGAPSQAHYCVSNTGTLVYGVGEGVGGFGDRRLLVVQLSGDTAAVPLAPRVFLDPRWSPDGRTVAYASGDVGARNIFTFDVLLGATPRQHTFDGDNRYPAWSPDGSRLAFSSSRSGSHGWDLFVKTVDDDTPAQVLLPRPGDQLMRHWPLEESVVFEDGPVSRTELWIAAPSATGEATPYLESEADLDDVIVSPDNRWAAYQSKETGTEEVYVRRFPEPRQRIPISEGGGQFPRWAPDGRTVYYWHAQGALIDTLYAARLQTEPTFAVLSREPVLAGSYMAEAWDLHPDGDRIVVAQRTVLVAEEQERFVVVVNWFEELKQRVGN